LKWSFLTHSSSGREVFDVPQLMGAYGSGMMSRTWYPPHYSSLVQGVQAGHIQEGFAVGVHLIREFSPEIHRVLLHRKKATTTAKPQSGRQDQEHCPDPKTEQIGFSCPEED
jgi:hypothetical protein